MIEITIVCLVAVSGSAQTCMKEAGVRKRGVSGWIGGDGRAELQKRIRVRF